MHGENWFLRHTHEAAGTVPVGVFSEPGNNILSVLNERQDLPADILVLKADLQNPSQRRGFSNACDVPMLGVRLRMAVRLQEVEIVDVREPEVRARKGCQKEDERDVGAEKGPARDEKQRDRGDEDIEDEAPSDG